MTYARFAPLALFCAAVGLAQADPRAADAVRVDHKEVPFNPAPLPLPPPAPPAPPAGAASVQAPLPDALFSGLRAETLAEAGAMLRLMGMGSVAGLMDPRSSDLAKAVHQADVAVARARVPKLQRQP